MSRRCRALGVSPCVIRGYRTIVAPTEDVKELKFLLEQWREPLMPRVRSDRVVPDSSNRMHTGLSVDHVHYLATCMMREGFRRRIPGPLHAQPSAPKQPHDIPVLVRGGRSSLIACESLEAFSAQVEAESHFARVHISITDDEWFCSLGNGHFTQALNCFRQKVPSIFTGEPFEAPEQDHDLHQALDEGIAAIVLRADTPIETRREISHLLNETHAYKWTVTVGGEVDITPASCALHRFTNFEAMSKGLDNESLTQLVRLELGVAKEMDERWDAARLASKLAKQKRLEAKQAKAQSSKL